MRTIYPIKVIYILTSIVYAKEVVLELKIKK